MKQKSAALTRLILTVALLLGGCSVQPQRSAVAPPDFVNARAIIIVRHADIDPAQKNAMGNDAPLLPAGETRARELAAMLRDAGINRVITSSALRTQETAAPLVQFLKTEKIDITPEQASGHGPERASAGAAPPSQAAKRGDALSGVAAEAEQVVDYLARTAKPTDVILIVHHHSVIPTLIEQFSHTPEPAIDDKTEYDRCYVILPDAEHQTYRILRLRYGGTPLPVAN